MALLEEAHKAARILLDHAYVRVLARAEPDAVCATALLTHALRREDVDFHVTWVPRLSPEVLHQLDEERNDALVLVGLSGDAFDASVPGGRKIVLDATPATLAGEAVLDPRHNLETHAQGSLSSLAFLLAVGMSRRHADLSPLALVGAFARSGVATPLRGLDAEILAEAKDSGIVLHETRLSLHGSTLAQALTQLDAPYVSGITGRARNVKKLVSDLKLSGDAPPLGLAPADAERLGSFLALRLLQQDAPPAALDALFRPGLRALQGPHTGLEAGEMARLVEMACAAGRCGLAFTALWPDAGAHAELLEVQAQLRDELVAALARAERDARREGPLVIADAPREGLCAPLAARLAASLVPEGRVAVARHAEGDKVHVAAWALGEAAPDLARAARHAAAATGALLHAGPRSAKGVVAAADESHLLKALAEGLG